MATKEVKKERNPATLGGLRRRAEELLRKTRTDVAAMPTEEVQTLVHVLQVYQTELEMQNDELYKTEVSLQAARDRYVDLYDSAPVGYLTIDRNSYIEEANLTAATLLKIERRELIGQPLARFFDAEESADALHLHVRETLASGTKQSCELLCTASDDSTFQAQLESCVTLNDDLPRCQMMLSDITDRKRAEEQRIGFGRILDDSQNEIYIFDAESLRFLLVNRGAKNNLGYTMAELQGLTPLQLKPEFTADAYAELIRPLHTGERSVVDFKTVQRRKDGSDYPVEVHLQLATFQGSSAYVAIILDITRRLRAERELEGHKRVLEMLAHGAPLRMVMQALVEVAEATSPGMLGSVLILDPKTNCFIGGFAPSLPDFYNEALVGLSIGEGVGSCGTAAYTGQRVIVEDVTTHPYWESYRDLAEKAGVRACWSEPIISTTDEVLGTFAMYYREPRGPDDHEMMLIRTTSYIAALAIEQRQNEEKLRQAHDRLEKRVQERTAELVAMNRQLEAAKQDLESEGELLRRIIGLKEKDRQMVSHDIHDSFLPDVQAAHMHVQMIESAANPDANELTARHVGALLRKAIAEGRRMIRNLRPIILDEAGVIEAITHLVADERRFDNLTVHFQHDVKFDRLEPRLEGVIFRIVQEALNNVQKHGQTDLAAIELKQQDDMLEIVVRDQGVGFDPGKVSRDRFGLGGIREIARLFGGTAKIVSTRAKGQKCA